MIYAAKNKVIDARFGDKQVLKMMLGDVLLYELPVYAVTCTFDNVTSNAPATVEIGESLSVTLSGVDGKKVQEKSVVVTMGGVDITSTAYNHSTKTITIASVTDNVSITAVGRPYDAEVEWLQSSGTQFIDPDVEWDDTTQFALSIMRNTTNPGHVLSLIGYRFVSQASTSGNMRHFFIYADGRIASRFGVSAINSTSSISTGAWHTFSFDGNNAKVDGTTYLTIANDKKYATITFGKIYLLYTNCGSYYKADLYPYEGKIKAATIVKSGQTVRDLIPVKNNNVGYMYDKVSGQLFGNAGSGAFTYGNDV